MKTLNDYVVEKTLKWSEYKESELSDYYSGNYMPFNIDYGTDIFNKSSRTTTCFDNSSGEIVMYCENCNETYVNKTDMLLELQILSENSKRLSPTRIICEECGSSYDINDIRKISRPWKLKDSCTRLVYDTIYDDNNGLIKLSIKICTMMVNKKFFSVDNKYKLIFNTITGQTYVYEDIQNKKNKIRPLHLKSCLSNMTYNAYRFDYILEKTLIDTDDKNKYIVDIFKKMYDKLYKKISHNLGYNPTTLEDYAKEYEIKNDEHIYNAKVLALYNRFPNLNPFFLISKYNNRDIPYLNFDNSVVVLTKMRKVKNTSKNPIKELLELYKVSDIEFFESYIKDNPSKLSQLVYFSKFIKNKYLIKDLLEIDESPSICDSEESVNELLKIKHSDKYCVTQFFKHISKEATEDEICDIIKNCFYNHNNKESFKNICKHYHIAKKINPKTKINFKRIKDLLIGDSYAHSIDSRWITDIIKDDLINSIYNNYKKKFNFKINTLDEFCEEAMSKSIGFNAYSLNILQIYQCNPTFNPYVLAKMLNINDYDLYSFNDNAFSGITSLNPLSTDVLGDLFKFYNIPNVKSLKKIVMNHPKSFSNLVFYASIFKDVNVLNNIMSKKCFVETNNMSYVELVIFNHNIEEFNYTSKRLVSIRNFIKRLIKEHGEVIASRKIIDAHKNRTLYCIDDSERMIETYKTLYRNENIDLTGSIKEIHDRLIKLTGGFGTPLSKKDFKAYKYSKESFELEWDYNEYSFRLVKNGKELVEIGADLNNCVGSYRKTVRNGECIIVSVTKNSKYHICIELRPCLTDNLYKYQLNQAKLNYNNSVCNDDESLNIVLKWMKENNIKDKSCDIDLKYRSKKHNHEQQHNMVLVDDIFEVDDYELAF